MPRVEMIPPVVPVARVQRRRHRRGPVVDGMRFVRLLRPGPFVRGLRRR